MPRAASETGSAGVPSVIHVRELAEPVAREIGRWIRCGELKEGDALPADRMLMQQFGVNRLTVREAFRILESESLVSIDCGPHGGVRVLVSGHHAAARYLASLMEHAGAGLRDAYQDCSLIEPACVSMLARNRTAHDLVRLEAAIGSARLAGDDPGRMIRAEGDFHDLLVELTGNRTLTMLRKMFRQIADAASMPDLRGDAETPGYQSALRAGFRVHERMVHLIEAKDSAAAELLWRKHLDDMKGYLY